MSAEQICAAGLAFFLLALGVAILIKATDDKKGKK